MNKLHSKESIETMDIRINEWKGIPPAGANGYSIGNDNFSLDYIAQRARELGWCNCYKYGVEYETNGKKPDLPDDLIIEHSVFGNFEEPVRAGLIVSWGRIDKFRIVDERYKPVELFPARLMQDGENNQVFKADMSEKSWHEKGELPPVGERCEWRPHSPTKANWKSCTIDYIHGDSICVTNDDSYKTKQVLRNVKFRPLKTERERFVEAVTNAVKAKHAAPDSVYKNFAIALYDAGFKAPEVVE